MGIVRFALRFPHTFYVVAALILFLGVAAIRSMPTDIFPEIRIPVVTVIWQYTGLSTPEMEQRVSTYSQYSISANVNGIKNMEAQTLNGLSIQKIYFQPDVNLDLAISQIVVGDQCHPRADAARHPAADRRAVQRLERAGAAAQPQLGYVSASSSSTTTASTGSGSSWRRFLASRCRRRPAASIARSWWTSTRRSCSRGA